MTDTANAPERIQAWMQPNFSEIGSWSVTRYPEVTIEYVLATHCDELVAAAYLDAAQVASTGKQSRRESIAFDIEERTPDNARAALTAYGERMKAEGARESQEKLIEARRRRDEWKAKAEGYDEVRMALREKVGTPWPPHLSRVMWAGIAADEKKRADDAEAKIAQLTEAAKKLTASIVALGDGHLVICNGDRRAGEGCTCGMTAFLAALQENANE